VLQNTLISGAGNTAKRAQAFHIKQVGKFARIHFGQAIIEKNQEGISQHSHKLIMLFLACNLISDSGFRFPWFE